MSIILPIGWCTQLGNHNYFCFRISDNEYEILADNVVIKISSGYINVKSRENPDKSFANSFKFNKIIDDDVMLLIPLIEKIDAKYGQFYKDIEELVKQFDE